MWEAAYRFVEIISGVGIFGVGFILWALLLGAWVASVIVGLIRRQK